MPKTKVIANSAEMKQRETAMHMREVPIDVQLPIYHHVHPDAALPTLAASAPFRAVIVADVPVTPAQQNRISDWLVAEGCLYAMAWGVAASSWDDAMDWSCLEKFNHGDVPAHGSVMTTWHDDEPLSEVFDFAIRCASHPTEALDELIVVHVAGAADPERIQAAFRVVCPSDHKEHP
ncbi:DUF7684 family protein [Roseateles chitinivorans]|uniref:DUF7684 family protein n=1 Tax=Roseateles chitinivorans TaxID=2917965 RepID=UPI003D67F8AF